jgi:sporulation protein YlmC with PRC-barrel domain
MLTRHSLVVAAVFCAFMPALAQDSSVPAASWPPAVRATAAYPLSQGSTQWLGSNLIGARVISASYEGVGQVTNLVVNDDGAIEAVVISIPGMLGLTKKNVAVTYKSLNIVRNTTGDGIDHITIAATRRDLLRVAEFKPLSRQSRVERQAALAR